MLQERVVLYDISEELSRIRIKAIEGEIALFQLDILFKAQRYLFGRFGPEVIPTQVQVY